MELIRPLYYVREEDIIHWRNYNQLNFIQCACKFTETCSTCHVDGTTSSKRLEIKKLIASLKEVNPFIEKKYLPFHGKCVHQYHLGPKNRRREAFLLRVV